MKTKILSLLAALLICTCGWSQSIEGYWGGELNVQGMKLGMFFNIVKTDSGFVSTLDVPQQGASGIQVSTTTFDGFNIRMEMAALHASYEGILYEGYIGGTYSESGMKFPLTLRKTEKKPLLRPQEPKAPFPYKQEEVTFRNEREGITLAGTLTMPEGNGTCPAVVMISGSGPQNRDSELYGHKTFAVIADFLTSNGIAVLRFDDRGVGASERGNTAATTLDLSYDAEAAVKFMKAKKCFSRIGVAGHSEGGLISFMLAERKMVDFVVSLAGPSVKGSEIIVAQQDSISRIKGMSQELIVANKKLFKDFFLIIDNSETIEGARPQVESLASILPENARKELMNQLLTPWMFYFCKYNPAKSIAATTCPVLVLNGTKDMQVIASQNIPAYQKIISQNPEAKFEFHVLPNLNHLFQHCTTGDISEYSQIEETISPEVLEFMKTFILSK